MNKGIIIVVMVIIIGIVIAIGMNYNKEDENKNIIDFDEIKKIINDAGYSIDDLKDIDDDTIKQKLSDMGFSDDEIDKIMEKIDEYKKTEESKPEESKTEDSTTCVPSIKQQPVLKILSYDENNKCPEAGANPANFTEQQLKDCVYYVYKDKNGNDVVVSADCENNALSEDSNEKSMTELKKCGLVFC